MTVEPSLFSFIFEASPIVKIVMVLLLSASVISWMFIFQQAGFLSKAEDDLLRFEEKFWSGVDLAKLQYQLKSKGNDLEGLEIIFYAGFKEYSRLRKHPTMTIATMTANLERALQVAQARAIDKLEHHLPFLATVGSVSPYVGLFGTVWGIMTSFQALSGVQQQATIAMVAPGISEALITTAMGLFAAIPAVIAYNRYSNETTNIANQYTNFQEEFTNLLVHQVYKKLSMLPAEMV